MDICTIGKNQKLKAKLVSFITSIVAIAMIFFSLTLIDIHTAKATTDTGCVQFVQGTDGKQYKNVYWFDFSNCDPHTLFTGKNIEVSKTIGDVSVSFTLSLTGKINATQSGTPMFAAYAPKGSWSALGTENNYNGINTSAIALGIVQGKDESQGVKANYDFTANITNIKTTGLVEYGFISADAEQFSESNDLYTVSATGAENNDKPVEEFTSLDGSVEGIPFGPAIFQGSPCNGAPNYTNTGVICNGANNKPEEPVFIAKYTDSNSAAKTFTTEFTQASATQSGSPNAIAMGFVMLQRSLTAPQPVKVVDPAKLTTTEQTMVKNAVKKANPGLEDTAITVNTDGTVTIANSATYANGTFTPKQTVFKQTATKMSVKSDLSLAVTGSESSTIFTLATVFTVISGILLMIEVFLRKKSKLI